MKIPVIAIILSFFLCELAIAHSGRTNSSGCHNNRKTGGYHCHRSSTHSSKTYTNYKSAQSYTTPSTSSTKSTSSLVLQTQQYLNQLGFNAGKEDGILGAKTKKAIQRFQKTINDNEDGKVSHSLLQKLKQAAAEKR